MSPREQTRKTKIGGITIGGEDKVLIQSMCDIRTSHVDAVVKQINECAVLGADMMRVSILDEADALALKEIKKAIKIPLIADIHFDYRLAILALENGADAIRINPGNIDASRLKEVVDAAKRHRAPIRIGVNSGSLDKEIAPDGKSSADRLVKSAAKHVKLLEALGFDDIVISLKGSNVKETIEAYELASNTFPYPLHVGITEAGTKDIGLVRSVAALAPLLLKGIGDTIRISLTDSPQEEVRASRRLLKDLGIRNDWPTLISCPTCGRTEVGLKPMADRVLSYLEEKGINATVAVMGCVVNGPGEAKQADVGIAGGKDSWVLFKKGEVVGTFASDDVFDALVEALDTL